MKKLFFILIILSALICLNAAETERLTHTVYEEYHLNWSPNGKYISHTTVVNGNSEFWYTDLETAESFKIDITGDLTGDMYNSWLADSQTLLFDAYTPQEGRLAIFKVGIDGGEAEQLTQPITLMASVSPDGEQFVYMKDGKLWTCNIDASNPQQLTFGSSFDYHPNWSRDGSKILFTSDRSGNTDIWYIVLETGEVVQVTQHSESDDRACWSPDGKQIVFVSWRENNDSSIWLVNADGTDPVKIPCECGDSMPTWSPDGSKIAYTSKRGGQSDIYIYTLPQTGITKQDEPVESFQLLSNYPNPFNASTRIHYRIEETAHVTLMVFDLLGNQIAMPVNEVHTSGTYSVVFDAKSLASGIYYYRLTTGQHSAVSKMLLIK